ncbi:MAG: hypothetical protein IPK19_21705 [Chloroflexi bacterium]|nr:hypothetical protein [Chloroflexota bacterium]
MQLLAVALGEPNHAEHFCGQLAPSLPCLTSISNDPYYEWGLTQYTAKDFLVQGLKLASATKKAKSKGTRRARRPATLPWHRAFIVDTGVSSVAPTMARWPAMIRRLTICWRRPKSQTATVGLDQNGLRCGRHPDRHQNETHPPFHSYLTM